MELEAVEVVITPAGPGNDGLVVLVVIGVALDSIEGCGDVVDIVANAGNLVIDGLLINDDFLQDVVAHIVTNSVVLAAAQHVL